MSVLWKYFINRELRRRFFIWGRWELRTNSSTLWNCCHCYLNMNCSTFNINSKTLDRLFSFWIFSNFEGGEEWGETQWILQVKDWFILINFFVAKARYASIYLNVLVKPFFCNYFFRYDKSEGFVLRVVRFGINRFPCHSYWEMVYCVRRPWYDKKIIDSRESECFLYFTSYHHGDAWTVFHLDMLV